MRRPVRRARSRCRSSRTPVLSSNRCGGTTALRGFAGKPELASLGVHIEETGGHDGGAEARARECVRARNGAASAGAGAGFGSVAAVAGFAGSQPWPEDAGQRRDGRCAALGARIDGRRERALLRLLSLPDPPPFAEAPADVVLVSSTAGPNAASVAVVRVDPANGAHPLSRVPVKGAAAATFCMAARCDDRAKGRAATAVLLHMLDVPPPPPPPPPPATSTKNSAKSESTLLAAPNRPAVGIRTLVFDLAHAPCVVSVGFAELPKSAATPRSELPLALLGAGAANAARGERRDSLAYAGDDGSVVSARLSAPVSIPNSDPPAIVRVYRRFFARRPKTVAAVSPLLPSGALSATGDNGSATVFGVTVRPSGGGGGWSHVLVADPKSGSLTLVPAATASDAAKVAKTAPLRISATAHPSALAAHPSAPLAYALCARTAACCVRAGAASPPP